jgi:predicted RNA-binding Zn-ribbon protein involved in translation (DUF1610 family)
MKMFKKTYKKICDSCGQFVHTDTQYCEKCGSEAIRKATKQDYAKHDKIATTESKTSKKHTHEVQMEDIKVKKEADRVEKEVDKADKAERKVERDAEKEADKEARKTEREAEKE